MEDGYTIVAEERNARSAIDFITYKRDIQHEIKEIGSYFRFVAANLQIAEMEKKERIYQS